MIDVYTAQSNKIPNEYLFDSYRESSANKFVDLDLGSVLLQYENNSFQTNPTAYTARDLKIIGKIYEIKRFCCAEIQSVSREKYYCPSTTRMSLLNRMWTKITSEVDPVILYVVIPILALLGIAIVSSPAFSPHIKGIVTAAEIILIGFKPTVIFFEQLFGLDQLI